MTLTRAAVVDYQNTHLTGTSLFLPGHPPEEGLICPFRFACQLARARNAKVADEQLRAWLPTRPGRGLRRPARQGRNG